MKKLIPACLLVGLLIAAGCAQYKPVVTDNPVRIALAPVINDSELAQVIAPLSRNVREAIAHSPAYMLVRDDQAEAVLHLRVLGLVRRALARDPEDTGRPLSYRENVRVLIEWESELPAPWGKKNVTRVESEILLYAQPELVTAESASMADLTESLTRKIIARLEWPASTIEK